MRGCILQTQRASLKGLKEHCVRAGVCVYSAPFIMGAIQTARTLGTCLSQCQSHIEDKLKTM